MNLGNLFKLGKKARSMIKPETIDKVAEKVKNVDPATLDKIAGKAGKVMGEKRAQGLSDRVKGMLAPEKVDQMADKAKGFVDKKEPAGSNPPDERHQSGAGTRQPPAD
ncbi:MAG: hypothetical protein WEB00_16095 [Dehalococcoidia bacterium]